ncbi:MAG: tyrosine--tRNA ligase [Deltaproteobacteria bacterium]|nr:tyrosine--tRNA ligase [Deltaproteobacteria bacterium]
MPITIPPAAVQFERLRRGAVDLNPESEFLKRLEASHRTQTPLRIKTGFDPTAPDLHLGHTVLMEKMAQFQRLGHEVIFLIGDYTARIGDPTGRNAMRPPLSDAEIDANAATYAEQVFKILDRERTRVEWNSRWLKDMTFKDVIELAARYNLGRMLERRDFRQRFDDNKQIALHEFLYPLMQGYDSVALKADVELGGHDQIFNLNVGRHLMEQYGQQPQCVLTVGLLVGLDGEEKMSKSKGNHVGITDKPDDMFGKIMSITDETMSTWYALLTDVDPDLSDPNEAKKDLAEMMTARFHSKEEAASTRQWWEAGRPPRDFDTVSVKQDRLYKVLVDAGLATSGADARRRTEQGGVRIDENRLTEPNHVLDPGEYMFKVGKKTVKRVVIEP